MSEINQSKAKEQVVNDAIALIKSGKEINYLNLILKLNNIDPKDLVNQEISLVKTPNSKTYTFTVGEKNFQLAEFIVDLMARDYREKTITG